MQEVFTTARNIVARILRVEESKVELGSRFKEDLGADSINLVEIAMSIEQEFGITVEDEEVAKITTVEAAVKYIVKKL